MNPKTGFLKGRSPFFGTLLRQKRLRRNHGHQLLLGQLSETLLRWLPTSSPQNITTGYVSVAHALSKSTWQT